MAVDKNILSVDHDDDSVDYVAFTMYLKDDTKRKLDGIFKEIDSMGEEYLIEIEQKKVAQNKMKAKYVKYIMKHSKNIYSADRLMSYEYADVLNVYEQIKQQRQSPIQNFFKFLFNL